MSRVRIVGSESVVIEDVMEKALALCALWRGQSESSHLFLFRITRKLSGLICSPIHQNIKEHIVKSTEQDTVHIFGEVRPTCTLSITIPGALRCNICSSQDHV